MVLRERASPICCSARNSSSDSGFSGIIRLCPYGPRDQGDFAS
jgi:hypothetical protein